VLSAPIVRGNFWQETWADENGRYAIQDIPVGTYTCEVSTMGYKTQRVTLTIEQDKTTTKDFILRKWRRGPFPMGR